MKKVLAIIAITTGAISVATALILGCMYVQDASNFFGKIKNAIKTKIEERKYLVSDEDEEEFSF